MDEFLEALARAELGKPSEDEEADEDEPLLELNYPRDYVITTWMRHKEHGALPESGAFNDQDPQLVEHDWNAITRRYNRIVDRLRGSKGDLVEEMTSGGQMGIWDDFLKD